MTFLFILCPAALVLVVITNLIPAGTGGGEVKERMERRGSADASSHAPIAPRVKFDPEDTGRSEQARTEDDDRHATAA